MAPSWAESQQSHLLFSFCIIFIDIGIRKGRKKMKRGRDWPIFLINKTPNTCTKKLSINLKQLYVQPFNVVGLLEGL